MSWDNILKKFGFTWSINHFFYVLDWRTMSSSSVKEYLNRNVKLANRYVYMNNIYNIPKFSGSRDKVVMDIFKWVTKNFTYITDMRKFGVEERWEDLNEVLQTKNGDCESLSLIVFCLARAYGVNPLQIKLVAGEVAEGGHCWVQYFPDYNFENLQNKWYIFDPAYDPSNTVWFDKRISAEEDTRYLKVWFEQNDLMFK